MYTEAASKVESQLWLWRKQATHMMSYAGCWGFTLIEGGWPRRPIRCFCFLCSVIWKIEIFTQYTVSASCTSDHRRHYCYIVVKVYSESHFQRRKHSYLIHQIQCDKNRANPVWKIQNKESNNGNLKIQFRLHEHNGEFIMSWFKQYIFYQHKYILLASIMHSREQM